MMSVTEENTLKCEKLKIKTWEAEFLKINFRKPNKDDISNAPSGIKESYRNYWKLKKLEPFNTAVIKDDVWGENLNKSYMQTSKLKQNKHCIKSICDKLKQKSSIPFIKKSTLSSTNKQLIPSENLISSATVQNENHILHSPLKQETHLEDIIPNCESNVDESPVMMKRFKTIQSVNLIPSPTGFTLPPKSLHFHQTLNLDWLERCNLSILDATQNNESKTNVTNIPDEPSFPSEMCVEKKHSLENSGEPYWLLNSTENNIDVEDAGKKEICDILEPCLSTNSFTSGNIAVSDKISSTLIPFHKTLCDKMNFSKETEDFSKKEPAEKEKQCVETKQPSKKQKLSKNSEVNIYDAGFSKKALHLKRKISSGTLNENYVRLDIKKKKFSRGHRPVNTRKLKWNKWKQMKKTSGVDQSNVTGCFKCGQFGHWARNCNLASYSKNETNDLFEKEDIDDVPLPTLEEAAKLVKEKNCKYQVEFNCGKEPISNNIVDESNASISNGVENFSIFADIDDILLKGEVKSVYEVNENGKPMDPPKAVYEALNEMGYSSFREGQKTAVMRVLSGLSTLVVLPTGSGKSLCYQLPAYMYAKLRKSVAIVVSPLVSLMEDQVISLPPCLHAVCLHSGMSDVQKTSAMEDIAEKRAQILLVSPETVISYGFTDKLLSSNMPSISFVCIDEVHCLSQWSHNFRPSYLQLYKVLTQKLGVKCILGLTATATSSAVRDITTYLDLKCLEDSVVGHTNVPHNLYLSVSRDKDKDKALIKLLNGDRFHNCSSIIIYCIRRVETERLAALIRTCMQGEVEKDTQKGKSKISKKRRFVWTAEAYHAGLAPPRRRSIQKKFMTGKLRVVVATIAFGMGLNKPDVRAIIHYNMPKNFESYVQEIGRAGRDGLDSHCHLFLDSEKNDLWEQQRHIYSNGIDRHTLRKLLKKIFQPCKCNSLNVTPVSNSEIMKTDIIGTNKCSKHEVAFSINDTMQELDMKQENISTLLCFLELHPKKWIELLSPTYAVCSIRCYGGSQQMHDIALQNPSLAAAIALDSEHGKKWQKSSQYSFEIIKVASAIGCKSSVIKRELKKLEWHEKRKTGVMVELSDLAFHVLAPGDLSDDEMDLVLDFLHNKVVKSEESQLKSLKLLFSVFQRYSSSHYWECCDEVNREKSEGIKDAINKYFDRNDLLFDEIEIENSIEQEDLSYVKQLIKDIICTHHDQNFTGRSIARIFHGISSPCFPSEVWGKVRKFWRCLLAINFNTILKMANEELRSFK